MVPRQKKSLKLDIVEKCQPISYRIVLTYLILCALSSSVGENVPSRAFVAKTSVCPPILRFTIYY